MCLHKIVITLPNMVGFTYHRCMTLAPTKEMWWGVWRGGFKLGHLIMDATPCFPQTPRMWGYRIGGVRRASIDLNSLGYSLMNAACHHFLRNPRTNTILLNTNPLANVEAQENSSASTRHAATQERLPGAKKIGEKIDTQTSDHGHLTPLRGVWPQSRKLMRPWAQLFTKMQHHPTASTNQVINGPTK